MSDVNINEEFQRVQIQQYLVSLVKLIPAEIIALYSVSMAFVPQSLLGSLFVAIPLAIMTPLYLIFAMKINKASQIITSSLAFVVWVFALGGPFLYFAWYEPWMAGTLLSLFTIVPPMIFGSPLKLDKEIDTAITAAKTGSTGNISIKPKSWREV